MIWGDYDLHCNICIPVYLTIYYLFTSILGMLAEKRKKLLFTLANSLVV